MSATDNIAIGMNFLLSSAEDTTELAKKIARTCKVGDIILLYGDVGTGKTTFARGFIKGLTSTEEEIVSPTFTLVQTYPMADGKSVWHYDLYRLKHKGEIEELGIDEAFSSGITLIEWPEIIDDIIPENALKVILEIEGTGRTINLVGNSDIWNKNLTMLKNWQK